ncbi:DoxX family protein [Frondihabitans sp. PAMC 28766]|uniref:DoxX family protein n=1 Tax=Frondihabitans sp. PAMC 28766 TaxID=1795630 RepID=UPI00078E0329|nr:DoxX family protein [Frondihabitans sp. PAMC 28766]AMM20977.1 DoxX family protein [Frondihabitans sp. PAMC 28766]
MTSTTRTTSAPLAATSSPSATRPETVLVTSARARGWLAALRIATGWVFLWAFLDKAFGLGFSTPAAGAWIRGGSPTKGFLTGAGVTGPLKPFFADIAGPATDILFMVGMLAIGIAVILGVGLRISAVVGSVVMVLMYLAEWPFTINVASTNPLVDYHIVYALALIVAACLATGDTFGFGRFWKQLGLVRKNGWLV